MKLNKSTKMVASFTIGALMLTTTVLAEVSSKSGYEQAKDALKYSAANFENKLSSYSTDFSITLKDNGKVIMSQSSLGKYDNTKNAAESIDTNNINGKNKKTYFYQDKECSIYKSDKDDTYNLTELKKPDEGYRFSNPFKEPSMNDVEKIADAVVGNLKDYVVVENKKDGSRELSGTIKETQIPAVINAGSSYVVKHQFVSMGRAYREEKNKTIPSITKDICIKQAKGKMDLDKNGLIRNMFFTGELYGKDDKGKEHNLTVELLIKVYDVNSTVVKKPNLQGEKVIKSVQNNTDEIENPQKYIGKYKNNIVIEDKGKFKKIGERILTINKYDKNGISGVYHEEYLKGFEKYKNKSSDFKFNADYKDDPYIAYFTVEGVSEKGDVNINSHSTDVIFNKPYNTQNGVISNGGFERVFE